MQFEEAAIYTFYAMQDVIVANGERIWRLEVVALVLVGWLLVISTAVLWRHK